MNSYRLSILGLGKLGACMAAAMAHQGASVVGVDVNSRFVDAINQGRAPVVEPGLQEMIAANRERLRATTSFEDAVAASDISFIIVPTPSDDTGGFSIRYAAQAAREIGRALQRKTSYHLVALTSTVLPGSTEHGILPVLEQESGKRCGRDFGLCYNPEFIALGSVIHDLLNPDFILIGESDARAGATLEQYYAGFSENDAARRPHEHRQRRAHEDFAQHLRHHEDHLRQHAGGNLRGTARRRRGRGQRRTRPRYAASGGGISPADSATAAPASRATTWRSPSWRRPSGPPPCWRKPPTA